MSDAVNCEYCVNYSYDDDITGNFNQCPYFKMGDEYRIVRKQM